MELIRGLHNLRPRHHGCVATIGAFDGVHRGHQAVIHHLLEKSVELALPSLIIVFEPLPREYFAPLQAPARIMSFWEKCRALEVLGAKRAINYHTEDFEQVLAELGLKDRINVILDIAGGDFIQKNINVAAPEGRIVYISFIRGARAEVNFGPLLMKRLVLTGSTLRAQSFAQKAVMVREILERVYPHLESGVVKPVVDRIFPLEEAEQAQAYMQSGQHMGKIILQM